MKAVRILMNMIVFLFLLFVSAVILIPAPIDKDWRAAILKIIAQTVLVSLALLIISYAWLLSCKDQFDWKKVLNQSVNMVWYICMMAILVIIVFLFLK